MDEPVLGQDWSQITNAGQSWAKLCNCWSKWSNIHQAWTDLARIRPVGKSNPAFSVHGLFGEERAMPSQISSIPHKKPYT